jgi:hypothetical protein
MPTAATLKQTDTQPLISLAEQHPYLMRAIKRLAQRANHRDDAAQLLGDLGGITAMVAEKFTNDRTAEGIQEALRLTVGCISLALHHAPLHDDEEAALDFLIEHGAEHTFQKGFRLIRELATLPEVAMVSAFDNSAHEQTRQLKNVFLQFCDADPNAFWVGQKNFYREMDRRKKILDTIRCAQWLRKHHDDGAIKEADMDADGVLSVAIIFATQGDGKIIAKSGQKKFQALIGSISENRLDFAESWAAFLKKVPSEYQQVLQERIAEIQASKLIQLMQKNLTAQPTKTQFSALLKELQHHGGSEVEVDLP